MITLSSTNSLNNRIVSEMITNVCHNGSVCVFRFDDIRKRRFLEQYVLYLNTMFQMSELEFTDTHTHA